MSTSATPAHDLLAELRDRGVIVRVQAGDLVLDAPTGAITPALTDRLKAHKPELLAILQPSDGPHGIAPGDLPMLDDFLHAFPSAEIVEVVTEDHGGKAASPARQAEAIIEAARERGDAPDLRDAWEERLAICTVSGGLPENDAQVIGLAELRGEA